MGILVLFLTFKETFQHFTIEYDISCNSRFKKINYGKVLKTQNLFS